jgi:predicted ATP-dependent serine protease
MWWLADGRIWRRFMSEPEVQWYIDRTKDMLTEIKSLITEKHVTNSMREIVLHDLEEIEMNLIVIIRKLKASNET